jgi:translocation and assembly module TamB
MGGPIQRLPLATVTAALLALPGLSGCAPLRRSLALDPWIARLEPAISRALGHPVHLGPLRRTVPGGLVLGPSRIDPTPGDPSHLTIGELELRPDALASLSRQQLVATLVLRQVQLDLRRNSQGQYWVFPPAGHGEPPPLDLTLVVADGARLQVDPGGPWRVDRLRGQLHLPQRRLALQGILQPGSDPANGRLELDLRLGLRPHGPLQLRLAPRALALEPVAALWPDGPLQTLRGRAWGAVLLDRRRGRWQARGPLRLQQLQAGRRGWGPPLRTPLLQVLLDDDRILTAPADLQWGAWRGRGAARVQLRPPGGGPLVELVGRLAPLGRIPALAAWVQLQHRRDHWQVPRLELRSGRSSLLAQGRLTPVVVLESRRLRLDPQLWTPPGRPVGAPVDARGRLQGDRWQLELPQLSLATPLGPLRLAGAATGHWRGPAERLATLDGRWTLPAGVPWRGQRLLGPLAGQLRWWQGRLWMRGGGAGPRPDPIALEGWWQPPASGGPAQGPVALEARLGRLPLARLDRSLPLQGSLAGSARLGGTLAQPRLTARLALTDPGLGPLRWHRVWTGGWGDGRLNLASGAARLTAAVGRGGLGDLLLQQGEGRLTLQRQPGGWRWQARALPLAPLRLTPPGQVSLGLRGLLDGDGRVATTPFVLDGRARLRQLMLHRLQVQRISVQGRLHGQGYRLAAQVGLALPGELEGRLEGRWSGPFDGMLTARRLQIAGLGGLWQGLRGEGPALGTARDLLGLMTDTLGRSLDEQLRALARARTLVAEAEQRRRDHPRQNPDDLRGLIDVDLRLRGPRLSALQLQAQARAHLWHEGDDRDRALQLQPLTLAVDGPFGSGGGSFSFAGLPLGLLALLTPVPEGLRGSLQGQGRWRTGPGPVQLDTDLALADASLRQRPLRLERGQLAFKEGRLVIDLALRSEGASSSVDLSGQLPLDPRAEGLELRLASRNDGLLFLTALAGGELDWQAGSADLQLLVRGRRDRPLANGFLRIRDGRLLLAGQPFREVQATAFFDFERLQLEQLTASLGERGQVEAQGSLPLWSAVAPADDPAADQPPVPGLRMRLEALPLRRDNLRLQADGTLEVEGSLQAPRVGGDLRLSRGRLLLAASRLQGPQAGATAEVVRHPESTWDVREPLVLLGPSVESSSGQALRRAIPTLALLRFDGLRLNLGPDLRLTVPPVLDFSTGGRLQLDGPFGPDVRLSGVVRLLKGQINVFTSFLRLDPDSPNVAVFTPSLGLIPYLDLALTTRVSDQVRTIDGAAVPTDRLQGAFSSLDRLNLVKVNVRVSGPADRIGENIVVRSSPPLPRERLVALLGGNTLAGLSGGDAGTALVTVLGQTLLTPMVGGLTELLGQRLNVALYPTYLDPTLLRGATAQDGQVRGVRPSSRRVPLQLVLGSEVGLDITDRLNLSVLAAPNRSDIPPEATLRFQASDLLGVQGSVDQEGRWQTQLQMFLRF